MMANSVPSLALPGLRGRIRIDPSAQSKFLHVAMVHRPSDILYDSLPCVVSGCAVRLCVCENSDGWLVAWGL